MGVTGIGIGIGIGPFDLSKPSGSALDVITSSNGAWWVTKERGKNAITASDGSGGFTAVQATWSGGVLTEDSTPAQTHTLQFRNFPQVTDGSTWTMSAEIKPNGRDWVLLTFSGTAFASQGVYFNVSTGATGTVTGAPDSYSITALGDGYYRCTVTATADETDTDGDFVVYLADADGGKVYDGDGSSGVFFRNPQFEESAAFTSYEETTGTALYGALLDQTGGGRHLLVPGGSANPVLLDHDGTNDYFWLPGTTGNYLSVPDSAALSVTGEVDIIANIAPTDATPATRNVIVSKRDATGFEYEFRINTTGNLELLWHNGTGFVQPGASSAPSLTDGADTWVRVTRETSGANYLVSYYKSSDGVSWTAIGTATVATASNAPVDSTTAPQIGAIPGSTDNFAGRIYRAIIKDGIDGTTVLDVNAADADPDSTTFTEASSNAATVTINRSSTGYKTAVVDQPMYVFATDDYLTAADAAVFDVGASDSFSVVVLARVFGSAATFPLLVKRNNLATSAVGWTTFINVNGNTFIELSDGTTEVTSNAAPGDTDSNAALTAFGGVRDTVGDAISSHDDGGLGTGLTDTTTGTLANSEPVLLGAIPNNSLYADYEVVGAAFIKGTAWTAAEISDIADALITANGGTP